MPRIACLGCEKEIGIAEIPFCAECSKMMDPEWQRKQELNQALGHLKGSRDHIRNAAGQCVSWCPACLEATERRNGDGGQMTTAAEIGNWFDGGVGQKKRYMIVVCDTFEHEDYPVYTGPNDDFWEVYERYNGKNMARIMEVYDLHADKDEQLYGGRSNRTPPRR